MTVHRPTLRQSPEITLLVAAAGVVAGVLTAVNAAAAQPVPFEDSLALARKHVDEGAPNRAVFHLRRHLEGHPDDTQARSLLARTYLDLGLTQAALSEIHLVLAAEPRQVDAARVLAEIQLAHGEPAAALQTLQRSGRPDADVVDERTTLLEARCLFELGRHGEVEILLGPRAGRHERDVAFLRLRGLNALELGTRTGLELAATTFASVTSLSPVPASNWNNLGFALERLGRLEEAYLAYVEAEGRAGGDRYAGSRARVERALGSRARPRTAAAASAPRVEEPIAASVLR